jgi:SAM-dependent methyltransferase
VSASATYVIRGGLEGRERLRVLARVMWPTTELLFGRIGIDASARCLDVGCGGGDVSLSLAALATEGSVLGTDLDEAKIEIAAKEAAAAGVANVEFRVGDVMAPPSGDDTFDVIYVRFLLTHLPDPAGAVANLVAQLAPGGVLVVEDIDFTGHFCRPDNPAFWKYVEWYTAAVQARGCDPNIGPCVPGLLMDADLDDVGVNVVQPAGFSGEVKLIIPITLEAIAGAVLAAELTTVQELEQAVDDLYEAAHDDHSLLSLPRVVQSWGRRAS